MIDDLNELKYSLNSLWEKPITDFTTLLYTNKNEKLLIKYDISFMG